MSHDALSNTIAVAGRNCWRIDRAQRAAVIVDADAYFRAGREAMLAAQHRIMLVGWDFDAGISLGGEREPGEPAALGEFILWLVARRPSLEIYLLRWDVGAIRTLFRGRTAFALARWMMHKRIHTRLDGHHPTGSSHHQKIVVIDDNLAFCGGIDMTGNRWDTRAHRPKDPGRAPRGGTPYGPWHDATTALEGKVAASLGDLARERWRVAGGGELAPVTSTADCWPAGVRPDFVEIDVAISRSSPPMRDARAVLEVESLFCDLIASARRYIYAESQYFASRRIAEAISKRLAEPDGPEVVLINPERSHGWLEPLAMDTARARLFVALQRCDPGNRFRIYHPVATDGEPIYVHAKIMVVDDRVLHIGSANLNNRSMRLDSECDVTIDAGRDGNETAPHVIASIRDQLIAEHLGVEPATVTLKVASSQSMIAAIESMRGSGRSLRPYEVPDLSDVEKWLADNEVLDPEGPAEMFEPLSQRDLLQKLRQFGNRVRGGLSWNR